MSPKTQSTRTPPTTPSRKGGARNTPRPSTPPRRWTTEAVGLPSSSSSSHLKLPTTPSRKSTKESAQPAPSTSQISLPKHTHHTPGRSAVSLPFSTHSKASSAGGRDRPGLMGPRPSNHDLGSFSFEHRARTKSHSTLTPPRAVMRKIDGMIKERDKADMEKELAKMKLGTDGNSNGEKKRSSRPSSSVRRQSGDEVA